MRAAVALVLASLLFPAPSFAQEKKAAKKPVAKKVQKAPQKKAPQKAAQKKAADAGSDWSRFQSSADRDLKADEAKRKAKK